MDEGWTIRSVMTWTDRHCRLDRQSQEVGLDTVTRTEVKVPINEIASSHMARRTFIGNIYKLVKDPNLVSALQATPKAAEPSTATATSISI